TSDLPLRRRLLYPLSYGDAWRAQWYGQGLAPPVRAKALDVHCGPVPTAPRRTSASIHPRLAPTQLDLGIAPPTPELPRLSIEPEWKAQQRLWGHSFHPMCSYLASFPAALTHAFIARYSRPGDVVVDPFSGRGTTPLQACAEGRIGAGNDLNPLAYLLTAAKVDPPS